MSIMTRTATVLLFASALAAGLGLGSLLPETTSPITVKDSSNPSQVANANSSLERERETILVRATRLASPSVVGIQVTTSRMIRRSYGDPFFDMFFGAPSPEVQQSQSWGSGVVIDVKGYVITNNHVVAEALQDPKGSSIEVNLPDGRRLPARLVGGDEDNDLAVLQIEADTLPVARLGNQTPIIGEWALAIGNPYGYLIDDFRPSVTVGVISAIDRSFTPRSGIRLRHVIQTDAAINPGNSGGALVNALGEVIGINTFIFTGGGQSQGSIGLGFAIPISRAQRIVQEIIKYGRVRNFTTGLSTDPLAAQAFGLQRGEGVLISEVAPRSPGAKGGLKAGDIVIAADGRHIGDLEDLRGILRLFQVGDRVALRIRRDGVERDAFLVLEEAKD